MKTFKEFINEGILSKIANKIMGTAPEIPKYKIGQHVRYEMHPPQKDGSGSGKIDSYSNGHYMINGKPINHFEIKSVKESIDESKAPNKISVTTGTQKDIYYKHPDGKYDSNGVKYMHARDYFKKYPEIVGIKDATNEDLSEGAILDAEKALKIHAQRKIDREKEQGPDSAPDAFNHEQIRKQLLSKRKRAQAAYNRKF